MLFLPFRTAYTTPFISCHVPSSLPASTCCRYPNLSDASCHMILKLPTPNLLSPFFFLYACNEIIPRYFALLPRPHKPAAPQFHDPKCIGPHDLNFEFISTPPRPCAFIRQPCLAYFPSLCRLANYSQVVVRQWPTDYMSSQQFWLLVCSIYGWFCLFLFRWYISHRHPYGKCSSMRCSRGKNINESPSWHLFSYSSSHTSIIRIVAVWLGLWLGLTWSSFF